MKSSRFCIDMIYIYEKYMLVVNFIIELAFKGCISFFSFSESPEPLSGCTWGRCTPKMANQIFHIQFECSSEPT